jgi:hypothetical protein
MWAHYAKNASGLVVEFQGLNEVFPGENTRILARPIPVSYDREEGGVSFDPRSHESIFFSKFTDWSYEEEVRVVLPLSECSIGHVEGSSIHLYRIPPTHVSRVIFGWNMSPEDVETVGDCIQRINPTVTIASARCVRGKVELG